jgi:hypothetical protein
VYQRRRLGIERTETEEAMVVFSWIAVTFNVRQGPCTTKLYDRMSDAITLDEVERDRDLTWRGGRTSRNATRLPLPGVPTGM